MNGRENQPAVLAAAISGSGRLREKLGRGEALRAEDRCLKRMQRAIEGFRGAVVSASPDALTAVFASAEEACQAALEMRDRVHGLPPVCGVKLAVRAAFLRVPAGADPEAAAAGLLARAGAEQILTDAATAESLPRALRDLGHGVGTAADHGDTAVEMVWHGGESAASPAPAAAAATVPPAAAPAPRPAPAAPPAAGSRLCVRYQGRSYLLDAQTPVLTFGRDPASNVVIEDRKASRRHARIERRGERYVLIDSSTNGSYVALGSEPEVLLHRGEALLHGSGSIGFGMPAADSPAGQARFEHL